uniref:Probable GTP diphosphokinase RSH3, chloroplastic n=1 Tax=Tanacetum cinerariifolium TaxID=118510 RepID=A0A6L2KPS5_TANCI|nr:probable GTP diphosphokinase RSH3, chloroplastic [Tanacetum cinerariifolium]
MAVPTIAIYTTPPYDFNLKPSSSPAMTKSIVGGLSSLFSSFGDELPDQKRRLASLSSPLRFSPFGSGFKRDYQSLVSVFHGPSSASSPLRFSLEKRVEYVYGS